MNVTMERTALRPWADQPRKRFDKAKMQELVDSLRSVGQLQALIVRPLAEPAGDVTHEVIVGERRWRASGTAGIPTLECRVLDLTDKQAAELAVMENVHRDDLTVMEEASGYQLMVRQGWDVAEISQRCGRKPDVIYTLLALCDLDEATQVELVDGTITRNTAQALGRIEDDADRADARERIVRPRASDRPLAEKAAIRLIQEEYLAPQKRAKAWESRRQALAREFPGVEIVPLKDAGRYSGPGSGWERADEEPQSWALAAHMRDQVVPTWGDLAEKHGAPKAVVPDGEGCPVLMVSAEPIKAAELLAGEKNAEQCIFPIAGGQGRHEQSLAKAKVDVSREVELRKEAEVRMVFHLDLMRHVFKTLMAPLPKGTAGAAQEARVRAVMGWLLEEDWLPDLDETMGTMGMDAEALGDGNATDGARRWALDAVQERGAMGLAAVFATWAVGGMDPDADRFMERMEPLAVAVGFKEPEPDENALEDARAAGGEAFYAGVSRVSRAPYEETEMIDAWLAGYDAAREGLLEEFLRAPAKKAKRWLEDWNAKEPAFTKAFARWMNEADPGCLVSAGHAKAMRDFLQMVEDEEAGA